MGKLTNLLKWKKVIRIKDERGLAAKDEEGNPIVVYMRVIGDKDFEDASLKARYASASRRVALSVAGSEDYISNVAIFDNATKEQCIEMIVQGRGANWTGEALSNVTVPELPKIEDVARDPDAPTLEELEKLDKMALDIDKEYRAELEQYVKTREEVLRVELDAKPLEELIELAKQEVIVVLSIQMYLDTLIDEKVWRAVYQDEEYTLREFTSVEEFQNLNARLKEYLREEYRRLEAGLEDIKN